MGKVTIMALLLCNLRKVSLRNSAKFDQILKCSSLIKKKKKGKCLYLLRNDDWENFFRTLNAYVSPFRLLANAEGKPLDKNTSKLITYELLTKKLFVTHLFSFPLKFKSPTLWHCLGPINIHLGVGISKAIISYRVSLHH